MNTIQFKSANLRTSVSRARIRKAVEEAVAHFDPPRKSKKSLHRQAKKIAKKK